MIKLRDNFIYSVDMVRLYTEIRPTELQTIMNKLQYNSYVEYREMKSIKAYRHNFYIRGSLPTQKDFINMDFDSLENMYQVDKEESYSFWLGAEHNARPFDKSLVDVVIQYNPNKCKDSEILKYLLENIFLNNSLTKVKDIDFAIDLPFNIKNIRLVRDLRSSFRLIDNGGDDLTYYMRKRGSNGHIKLYNKARENKEKHDKTRYEITLKIDMDLRYIENYVVDYGLFPDLIILDENKQMEIENTVMDGNSFK